MGRYIIKRANLSAYGMKKSVYLDFFFALLQPRAACPRRLISGEDNRVSRVPDIGFQWSTPNLESSR